MNQTPMRYYDGDGGHDVIYDIAQCVQSYTQWLGPHRWLPIGPEVRTRVVDHHAEELRAIDLDPHDWLNIIDADYWQRPQRRVADGTVRIGRHSRDHASKFPTTAHALAQAYPSGEGVEVHVLGGADSAREVDPSVTQGWIVHPYDSMDPREFLHGLDVYVYFTDPSYVEAFGRAPLEAIASGIPTVVPRSFEPLFGDGAIYAEVEEVRAKVDALMADTAAYQRQVERGHAVIREKYGYEAHLRRLQDYGVAAR